MCVIGEPVSQGYILSRDRLTKALAGAQVLVDVAESPSFEDRAALEFFVTSSRNLLAAEAIASVGHHVALSVVGVDRVKDSSYFRAKAAQEDLIKASSIPYTIVRSTVGTDAGRGRWRGKEGGRGTEAKAGGYHDLSGQA
jgi:uncharacterized protein YbjT (DUF2867 family)